MAKLKLSDKLFMYSVDEHNVQPVLEFLQANGRKQSRATKSYYGNYMIVFNKEKDEELALMFRLKFSEIARPMFLDYTIDDGTGEDDDGANYGTI